VLNHAIHMIALTRCRRDQTTKEEFMAKKRADGKTGKEALRALQRHIANDIYRHMKADCRPRSEPMLTTLKGNPLVAGSSPAGPTNNCPTKQNRRSQAPFGPSCGPRTAPKIGRGQHQVTISGGRLSFMTIHDNRDHRLVKRFSNQ
jgi:hypothetical protein